MWFNLPKWAGFAVAACWVTLALGNRFEAGGEWRDRLGFVLGGCWIGLGLLSLLASWLCLS